MLLRNGEKDIITLFATDTLGSAVTGASLSLVIENKETSEFFNGSSFSPVYTTLAMVEVDSTNLPGLYRYEFISPLNNVDVAYLAFSNDPRIKNTPWIGEATIGKIASDIETARKYTRNRTVYAGSQYTVYEDDGVTPFEVGFISRSERDPS